MQSICDLFNIILFVTVVGGAFTILSLVANRVMRFTLPLWFSVFGMAAYIVPLPAPGLFLIPPESHSWIPGYYIACAVWFGGLIVLTIYDFVRTALAHRAIRSYLVCEDERIKAICVRCAEFAGMKKVPIICILNWMNPLAWVAKKAFALHCETDCDRSVLACL